MTTGSLPMIGYPHTGNRRYMANEQLPWSAHFSRQETPGLAWRTRFRRFSQINRIIICGNRHNLRINQSQLILTKLGLGNSSFVHYFSIVSRLYRHGGQPTGGRSNLGPIRKRLFPAKLLHDLNSSGIRIMFGKNMKVGA